MIDLPTALYVISNVSFCCPQDVPKALMILFLLDTLSSTWLLCLLNDSEVSRWTRNSFGHCTRGSCESSVSIFGWVLAWYVSGVNNVTEDFRAGSYPSGTQLFPQDSCLGYPPYPEY